jgi:predicted Zn-dependent protease
VITRDGVEIGRIVETPATSLEADALAILEGRGPEPKYGAEAFVHQLFTDLPAEEALKALVSAGPEIAKRGNPDSLGHYAEYDLLRNGRAREAKAVLDLHLSLNPRSAVGHILMSDALLALGRKEEAKAAIERALAIEPANDRALRAAAKLRDP